MGSFTRRSETKRFASASGDHIASFAAGDHVSQSGRFFHHAFFREGHSEAGAPAAISAAPAPADLLLRYVRCAVAARSLQLPLTALLHAGRQRQPQSHQLLSVRERGEDVVPQRPERAGPADGGRITSGGVREHDAEPPCRPAAGGRAARA